ncbi:MAG: four helix bundle protein [Parvicella sp.]|jgi:four helix bundle protein
MRDYKKYEVWQDSIELNVALYSLTDSYPDTEKFGLISQIRRCSVSISSNIAEGSSRSSEKEFSRFLEIAQGSCFELETQILISKLMKFISAEQFEKINGQILSIAKQLSAFKKKLKTS